MRAAIKYSHTFGIVNQNFQLVSHVAVVPNNGSSYPRCHIPIFPLQYIFAASTAVCMYEIDTRFFFLIQNVKVYARVHIRKLSKFLKERLQ